MLSEKRGFMKEEVLSKIVKELCDLDSYKLVYHKTNHDVPMPSVSDLEVLVELIREVLFPGYFGNSELKPVNLSYYTGMNLDKIFKILSEQITRGFCFECSQDNEKLMDEKD